MNRVERVRGPLPSLTPEVAEEARDLLCRAQAALFDEHPAGALRSLRRLHELLVPPVDGALPAGEAGADGAGAEALSVAIGFPGLYRDLPDIDVEREPPLDLLVGYAARADGVPIGADGDLEEKWTAVEALLGGEPLPRSRWWRRLCRSSAGPLGDRARVQILRDATIVLDRPPPEDLPGDVKDGQETGEARTDLGRLRAGDRMTLQFPMPLPGRVAVLHAAGNESEVELSLVLPGLAGEDAPRRAYEVVEVVGELSPVAGAAEHGMVLLWVPEVLPPGWIGRVLREGRLPPEARAWLYRYEFGPC